MLSISGLRGIVGSSLTPVVAARYGAAVGSWLRQSGAPEHPHVVVGRDSRPSGHVVEQAAVAGLLSVGCRVTTLGLATTPGVAVMVDHLHADAGLVLTASHNPIAWNGIKTLRHDGLAPPPDQAQQIINRFKNEDLIYCDVHGLRELSHDDSAATVHVKRILHPINADAIHGRKFKVVLDSVHGAGGPSTARLLHELGVELVHLYGEPTGQFPHTPEPTAENLTGLCDAVRQHKADLGFAQDPDADRLAIVDETGRYIGEEYTLALCAEHVLSQPFPSRERSGRFRDPGEGDAPLPRASIVQRCASDHPHPAISSPTSPVKGEVKSIAANLSTSRMVDDIAAKYGAVCHRTPVGEANVAAAMIRHGCPIGGEGNGGVIWPVVSHVRDSLAGIALVLELLATRGGKLSELVRQIPPYAIVKDKLPIQPGLAERAIGRLREALGQPFPLPQRSVPAGPGEGAARFPRASMIAPQAGADPHPATSSPTSPVKGEVVIDLQDGLRMDWPGERKWVHLRASNTEPILRIIAEATTEAQAKELIAACRAAVGS